ncbi:MAG TPA: MATE family efflux transporter, partial [Vicinamibacterales bacterium]|nr:MATE family efflux transporter [Vicinamibacterales bacterium]
MIIEQLSTDNTQGSTTAAGGGAWATIREALRGSHGEYTEGPIGRAILLLAVPMVLELALESVFAVVDVFFVGRLGADAVATIGLTEALMTIIYSALAGLSVGATATVARRIGERDPDGAAIAAVQAIALGVLIAVPAGVAGAWFARPLLAFMGATPGILAHSTFATILLGLNGVIVMLFLVNAVFRGAGEAAIAMRVLWIANVFNLILDPCLIFGLGPFPELGVTGAAVATTTGRTIGVLAQLYVLWRGKGRIVIRRRHLRLDPRVMAGMVRLSGVAVFQSLVGTTSYVGMVRIVASFGGAAVAACTITVRILIFALLPAWGLANAAATLVGQNLGAGKPERAEASVWRACLYNLICLGAVGILFIVFAAPIVGWFTSDAEVAAIAARGLRITSSGFLFYSTAYVLTQSFNGAGDTWTP